MSPKVSWDEVVPQEVEKVPIPGIPGIPGSPDPRGRPKHLVTADHVGAKVEDLFRQMPHHQAALAPMLLGCPKIMHEDLEVKSASKAIIGDSPSARTATIQTDKPAWTAIVATEKKD